VKQARVVMLSLLLVLLCSLFSAAQQSATAAANATVPPLIPFSSVAADEGGNSLSGVVSITFSLYTAQRGGAPLWTETQDNIQLDPTGHYSVQLGITQPNGMPTTLFTTGEARWLGVRIAEQGEQPRVLLLSVPYALKAGDAATIGGLPPSAFVLAAAPFSSATGSSAAPSDASATPQSSAPPPTGTAITGTGTVNYLPLWDSTSDIISSVLFQFGTGAAAKVGINTTTPATTLDLKGAGTIRGTLSLPATGAATATGGKNSQPLNLAASSFDSTSSTAINQTFQWQSEPAGNDTSTPSGTLNLLFGEGATKPSETGLHIASNGIITFNAAQTFPNTITGVATATGSGLTGGGTTGTLNLGLLTTCTANQVLQWNGTAWVCASVGTGTVTSVASGAGLTGGPITGAGTLSIATGGVTNAMLANSYAQLGAANTFTGNQTVTGTLNATSSGNTITGSTSGTADSGVTGTGSNTTGTGVLGIGSNGVAGQSSYVNGDGVFGSASSTTGLATGVLGTTLSPTGYGVEGQNNAATGNSVGVYGTTTSSSGYGVEGQSTFVGVYGTGASAGVSGQTSTIGGYGVEGTSPSIGVYGTGVAGVDGVTTSTSGYGVEGFANSTTGTSSGVYGANSSTSGGAGVMGNSLAASGPSVGVYGLVNSPTGYGVEGAASGGTAGFFQVQSSSGTILQGNNGSTTEFKVDSAGDVTAAGLVSGSSFQIGGQLFDFGSYANSNAFLGFAGNTYMTGVANTASGLAALATNTTGASNTASGFQALLNNCFPVFGTCSGTLGSYNTATGFFALINNTTGYGNTATGSEAGTTYDGSSLTGDFDTALGFGATFSTGTLTNATAIGAGAMVSESNALVLGNGVNVGINTSVPGATLEVDGPNQLDVLIQAPESGVGAGLDLNTTGSGGLHWEILDTGSTSGQGANKLNIRNVNTSTDVLTILADGHVGIGTTSADNTLSVNGSADKPGGGSWGTFSDGRLKTVNGGYTAGLSQVMKIHPVHYRYKADNAMGIRDTDEHIGVVAQDVQKVIPEAVTENSKGYLLVNNDPIIWTMLNAIKEQQREIKQQQNLLRAQRAAMRSLQAEVRETRESLRKVTAQVAATRPALVATK